MPWVTPNLRQVRQQVRDDITASLAGAASFIANSVLRIMADAQAGLARMLLMYLDWLARQLMPDSAETIWLDRHGDIWLVNSDGTTGRKNATFAHGTVLFTGTENTYIPQATLLRKDIDYETTEEITIGVGPTECAIRALTPGIVGNLLVGETLTVENTIAGVDAFAEVIELRGGTDAETDDELRVRVLERIRKPPMGGDADDYVAWSKAIPSVTRSWCTSEMGMGTVSVRFMCDGLRDDNNGFPLAEDVSIVRAELDRKRPVAVRDLFVMAPLPQPIAITLDLQDADNLSVRAQVEQSIREMLHVRAHPATTVGGVFQPAATIYQSWIAEAVGRVVENFTVLTPDIPPAHNGAIAQLGVVTYVTTIP